MAKRDLDTEDGMPEGPTLRELATVLYILNKTPTETIARHLFALAKLSSRTTVEELVEAYGSMLDKMHEAARLLHEARLKDS